MSQAADWTLYVDERVDTVAESLEPLGYTVHTIPENETVNEILTRFEEASYEGVLVTADAANFLMSDVPDIFTQGLILVEEGSGPETAQDIDEYLQAVDSSLSITLDCRDETIWDIAEKLDEPD